MGSFRDKIQADSFTLDDVDISEIEKLSNWLPKNGVMDINIAEKGSILTLHGQNICQEHIAKVDRLISALEGNKNKAWSKAALEKAAVAGHKTVKNREWFAQADDEYIEACNELALAKAAKKWLENKAGYFSGWHYAFKTFIKRDYGLEKLGNFQVGAYNTSMNSVGHTPNSNTKIEDMCGEIQWQE